MTKVKFSALRISQGDNEAARRAALDDIQANNEQENTPILICGLGRAVSEICSLSDRAILNEHVLVNPHRTDHSLPSDEHLLGKLFDNYATGG